jgi:zinc protease
VGAISEAELSELLDKTFGALPEKSKLKDIADIKPALGDDIAIEMPVPNASITMVYQGLKRDDPDFFAAHLMNHILGGGSFSSRLYEELREKRGLTYGVSSGIVTSKHSTYLIASNSTRAENRKESVALMRSEFERMAEKGVTQEELNTAKKYVAGSYAINNLDTSGKIAGVLVGLQTQKLGKDYISNRIKQIEAVTIEDVNRMAKKLLSVEPSVVVVGPPAS